MNDDGASQFLYEAVRLVIEDAHENGCICNPPEFELAPMPVVWEVGVRLHHDLGCPLGMLYHEFEP